MADRASKKQNLQEAEAALHQLMIGKKIASATMDGRAVSYVSADIPRLQAYILSLKTDLGLAGRRRWPGAFR